MLERRGREGSGLFTITVTAADVVSCRPSRGPPQSVCKSHFLPSGVPRYRVRSNRIFGSDVGPVKFEYHARQPRIRCRIGGNGDRTRHCRGVSRGSHGYTSGGGRWRRRRNRRPTVSAQPQHIRVHVPLADYRMGIQRREIPEPAEHAGRVRWNRILRTARERLRGARLCIGVENISGVSGVGPSDNAVEHRIVSESWIIRSRERRASAYLSTPILGGEVTVGRDIDRDYLGHCL